MPDLDTSRIPREALIGLLSESSNIDRERVTAPMPVARLDELLGEDKIEEVLNSDNPGAVVEEAEPLATGSNAELIVRFKQQQQPVTSTVMSHHVIVWGCAVALLIVALILVLV
ncbi:MAG TPA: hypothetical protein VMZ53_29090 [Kofleriaceae bacterium]|nr:hypothetical protein [Kofleriaceae bacterium]